VYKDIKLTIIYILFVNLLMASSHATSCSYSLSNSDQCLWAFPVFIFCFVACGSIVLVEPGSPHVGEVSKPCFRQLLGLLGRGVSPSQGLYLHRTTQHRKTRTNIHALSGIRTHDSSIQAATVIGT
jgi:hypothetical protein